VGSRGSVTGDADSPGPGWEIRHSYLQIPRVEVKGLDPLVRRLVGSYRTGVNLVETSSPIGSVGAGADDGMVADTRTIDAVVRPFLNAPIESILAWPPDVFVLTARLLLDTEGYRLAVSPPCGEEWPPAEGWAREVTDAAGSWAERAGIGLPAPDAVRDRWESIWDQRDTAIEDLRRGKAWDLVCAILTLHAMADQAAWGLSRELDPEAQTFEGRAWKRLLETGSLAHFPLWQARVLPKSHLAQGGINLRSLSRYLAVHTGQIDVSWSRVPMGDLEVRETQGTRYNLLLLPWPLETPDSDFEECSGPLMEMPSRFGFFRYAPRRGIDLARLGRVLDEAIDRAGHVDGIVLPEAALTPDDVSRLEDLMAAAKAEFLVAGVNQSARAGELGESYAHVALYRDGSWHRLRVNKHHRWHLDSSQIEQYGLAGRLDPERVWWEAIEVPLREMHILDIGGGATTSVVICEDLARLDVVAEVLRYVGPTLVIALLMDGPQLSSRWSARYASVLADDPGSTVLTLTSLGMALRSCPPGHEPSRVVALWKDPERGLREIALPPGTAGALVEIGEQRKTAWTADGREHEGRTPRLVLNQVTPVGMPRSSSYGPCA
jgi:hypothetical protein